MILLQNTPVKYLTRSGLVTPHGNIMTQLQLEYDGHEMIGDDIGRQHIGEINRKWDFQEWF